MNVNLLDLFSGIGGFPLGLEMAGIKINKHYFSEIDKYATRVYRKNFPEAEYLGGVEEITEPLEIDIICGGFPCQDISVAGKQAGLSGARSGLFYEVIRIAEIMSPRVIYLENVANLLNLDGGEAMGEVLRALSSIGYDAQWYCVPASHVGAPHIRDRIWIVAYPNTLRGRRVHGEVKEQSAERREHAQCESEQLCTDVSDANDSTPSRFRADSGEVLPESETERFDACSGAEWWSTEPDVGRVANGIPSRVDRLKCLGNAVVPQCVAYITELLIKPILRQKGNSCY